MIIKKFSLIMFMLVACMQSFGQSFKTEEEVYAYLKDNLLTIDKVEGIYKCSSYSQANNATPVKQPIAAKKVAIVKSNDVYLGYWIVENTREVYQKSFMQIKKRDYISAYDAKLYEWAPKELEFIDETSFKIKKEKPKNKTTDDGTVESYYFEKVFPSQTDIDNERARQEASNPKSAKCTGFLISSNLVVTNLHVVEKAKSIHIKGVRGDFSTTYTAQLKQSDKNNDIAILAFDDATIKLPCPITLSAVTPDVGKDIFVLAYPLTAATGNEGKLTNGIVSSRVGAHADVGSFQINVPMQPGNVGGPVFDKAGALAGVISATRENPETNSYCVKAAYIKNLIDAMPVKVKMPPANTLAAKSLPEKVKTLSKMVYIIEVDY